MSDNKHGKDELFTTKATDADDSGTDTASTTEKDEPAKATGSDEESKDLSPADKAKDDFKKAAIRDIKAGTKTLDDYEDKPWLKEIISRDLEAEEKARKNSEAKKEAKREAELETRIQAKLEARQQFDGLKATLNKADTTKAQRELITAKFKELSPKLGDYDALEIAMGLAGVEYDESAQARKSMRVPNLGSENVKEMDNYEKKVLNHQNLSQEEIQKLAIAKSRGMKGR